ncbi:hypothetical protein NL676_030870 [Syzygium grande]|nr:hypothetical protein NL676_030870 [Syzygium grande]
MDADSWSARLSSASKRYQSALQSRSDMLMGFEEIDEDDIREEFSCPFCSEYFDIVGLCCHMDDEHPMEAKNGVCPVCTMRVGVDMVAHITLQHGNIFKISFQLYMYCTYFCCITSYLLLDFRLDCKLSALQYVCLIFDILNGDYVQRKRKSRKAGNHSTLFLLRRELREGTLQSLFGGSSCVVPSSNAAPDPLLSSFILPMNDDFGSTKSRDMTETSLSKKSSDGTLSERKVQSAPLSVKEQRERLKRCDFVRGVLLSTVLDDGL